MFFVRFILGCIMYRNIMNRIRFNTIDYTYIIIHI